MKIIIAPSKAMRRQSNQMVSTTPIFLNKQQKLYKELSSLSVMEIHDNMHISFQMANRVYNYYHQENELIPCIYLYFGTVFKQLQLSSYQTQEFDYLNNHLRILSAYYGVLKPSDEISFYRLDMTTKLNNINLYSFWHGTINQYFKQEDYIINLASAEFSKLMNHPNMITIDFIEIIGEKIRRNATYVKTARGKMLHIMATKNITSIDQMKQITFDDYQYDSKRSSESVFVFSRSMQKRYIRK